VISDPLMVLTFRHYAPALFASRVLFPVDFPAIRFFRHDDSPEENLWAGRNILYKVKIVPLADFQNTAGKYLILASDGNWLLDDLAAHHYGFNRLNIDTRAEAIGGFTPLAHGTPAFYLGFGGAAPFPFPTQLAWRTGLHFPAGEDRMSAHPQPQPQTQRRRPLLVPDRKASGGRRSLYVWLGIVLALIAAAWIYSYETREVEVQVVAPVRQDIASTVASTGVVVPVHDYPVRANFGGLVQKIYVHVGEKVHAGQMLVQMKDQYAVPRLDTARAALDGAEADLENAQENGTQDERIGQTADLARAQSDRDAAAAGLASLQKLEQRGSASQGEVSNAMRQLRLDNVSLQALQERMAHRYSPAEMESLKAKVLQDKDELGAERVSWANANISAPISGTIYILPVLPHDFVPAGMELMHVADLSQFEVRANFYEFDLAKLKIGEPVTIRWDGQPGESWSGKVISRPMAVDRNGPLNVGQCLILLTSPINDLPINATVGVTVQAEKHSNVLTIPHQALHVNGPENFVYVVSKGRLKEIPVALGLVNDMTVEVTSGLTGHDAVVLRSIDGSQLKNNRRAKAAHKPNS
jgi:multidrug efflux pump subunit AcrA (membrane-fusion protein)